MAPARDTPGVIAPPPLIYAGFLLGGILLDAATGFLGIRLPWWVRWLLALGLAYGSARILLACLRRMKAAGTRVEPWQPTTALVTDGPYRWSRNPIYLAMALAYLALALLFDSIFGLLLLPGAIAVIQLGVIAREEAYLEAKFGAAYRSYKARVRPWL